jgi:outer membrane protein TolC
MSVSGADYFPTLSAFGGYSYGKPNLDRFNNTWNDYFTVGANLTWSFNFGNRTARKSRAARFAFDAATQDRKQIEETLTRDAALYYEQLKYAHSRYQSAVTETRIARSNYSLAEAQFRDGIMAANRLLEIAADLNSAEATLASSLADFHIALSAYYYAIGSANLRRGL